MQALSQYDFIVPLIKKCLFLHPLDLVAKSFHLTKTHSESKVVCLWDLLLSPAPQLPRQYGSSPRIFEWVQPRPEEPLAELPTYIIVS